MFGSVDELAWPRDSWHLPARQCHTNYTTVADFNRCINPSTRVFHTHVYVIASITNFPYYLWNTMKFSNKKKNVMSAVAIVSQRIGMSICLQWIFVECVYSCLPNRNWWCYADQIGRDWILSHTHTHHTTQCWFENGAIIHLHTSIVVVPASRYVYWENFVII